MKNNRSYYYSDIPWRYTSLRAAAFGLDPWIMVLLPLSFLTLAREWPTWMFYLYAAFAALIVYARFRGFTSFRDYLAAMRTRAGGVQWPTR